MSYFLTASIPFWIRANSEYPLCLENVWISAFSWGVTRINKRSDFVVSSFGLPLDWDIRHLLFLSAHLYYIVRTKKSRVLLKKYFACGRVTFCADRKSPKSRQRRGGFRISPSPLKSSPLETTKRGPPGPLCGIPPGGDAPQKKMRFRRVSPMWPPAGADFEPLGEISPAGE